MPEFVMRPLDITGQKFGNLTAVCRVPNRGRRTVWKFRCDCGTEKEIVIDGVVSLKTRSCGCLLAAVTRARSLKHGGTTGYKASPEYKAWCHAKSRCENPLDKKFYTYGARGVKMCKEWSEDFAKFRDYVGPRPDAHTLDRIDVNGNYEPGNVRWATSAEQARNRTQNIYVEIDGERMVLKDAARRLSVNYKTLHALIRYSGTDPQRAVDEIRNASP
jgi:hypothetical protein